MLIILLYLLFELIRNNRIIEVDKKSPNHPLNFIIRIIPVCVLYWWTSSWTLTSPDWAAFERAVVAFVSIFWFSFDMILNLMEKKPITSLGRSSVLDRFQNDHPNSAVWFVWKAVFAVFGILQFYFDHNTFDLIK